MAYISLYRKYRSQSFGEVMGQAHITTVLQNAIRMGRIAHAYLLCGPRGCGKTSTARLLARALNCEKTDHPTEEPCGVCSLCVRIRGGSCMDVIEMDAASETGIDDVREKIIENAKFAPAEARFKVYIIDEVHDLSLKAFDSLLKTIEEPPPHVVFILATTEAHKVPITVRSRCQRMDFRRGSLQDLMDNLRRVLDAESIAYEPDAVVAVARAAEGSFRDSLSLLEQALAYTDGTLTAESVHASIGTVGAEMLDAVVQTIAADDLHGAFLKAGELVETGKDVKQTLIALQLHLRDLLVASTALSPQALPEVSPERFSHLKEQARAFKPAQMLQMLDVLADTERDLRFTNQHRLLLERAFWSVLPSSLASAEVPAAQAQPPAASVRPAPQPAAAPAPSPPRTAAPTPVIRSPEPTPVSAVSSTETVPADAAPDVSRIEIDLEGIRRIWGRVIKRVLQMYPAAKAVFGDEVVVNAFDGKFVAVGFPREFERSRADRPKSREALERALALEIGAAGLKVRCVLSEGQTETVPSGPEPGRPLMDLLDMGAAIVEPPIADPLPPIAGIAHVSAESNGVSAEPEPVVTPQPRLDEHAAFVEIVKKELDCLPFE